MFLQLPSPPSMIQGLPRFEETPASPRRGYRSILDDKSCESAYGFFKTQEGRSRTTNVGRGVRGLYAVEDISKGIKQQYQKMQFSSRIPDDLRSISNVVEEVVKKVATLEALTNEADKAGDGSCHIHRRR
jgi:hypothetical protein